MCSAPQVPTGLVGDAEVDQRALGTEALGGEAAEGDGHRGRDVEHVDRPSTSPSMTSPPNGSSDHPSGLTGTTSVWPMRHRAGAVGSLPSILETIDARPDGSRSWRLRARHLEIGLQEVGVADLRPESGEPSLTQALRMSCCNSSVLGPVNSSISVMNPFSVRIVRCDAIPTDRTINVGGRGASAVTRSLTSCACREGLDLTTARVDDLLPRSQLVRRTQRLRVWPAALVVGEIADQPAQRHGPARRLRVGPSHPLCVLGCQCDHERRSLEVVGHDLAAAVRRRRRPTDSNPARAPAHRQAVDRHRPGRQDLEVWHVGTQRSTGDHRPRCVAGAQHEDRRGHG